MTETEQEIRAVQDAIEPSCVGLDPLVVASALLTLLLNAADCIEDAEGRASLVGGLDVLKAHVEAIDASQH